MNDLQLARDNQQAFEEWRQGQASSSDPRPDLTPDPALSADALPCALFSLRFSVLGSRCHVIAGLRQPISLEVSLLQRESLPHIQPERLI